MNFVDENNFNYGRQSRFQVSWSWLQNEHSYTICYISFKFLIFISHFWRLTFIFPILSFLIVLDLRSQNFYYSHEKFRKISGNQKWWLLNSLQDSKHFSNAFPFIDTFLNLFEGFIHLYCDDNIFFLTTTLNKNWIRWKCWDFLLCLTKHQQCIRELSCDSFH